MRYNFMPFAFGAALQQHRGITDLRAAAEQCGVSASTLSRLENGSGPDLPTFMRLCSWMSRSPMDFIVTSEQPPATNCCAPCTIIHPRRAQH